MYLVLKEKKKYVIPRFRFKNMLRYACALREVLILNLTRVDLYAPTSCCCTENTFHILSGPSLIIHSDMIAPATGNEGSQGIEVANINNEANIGWDFLTS